MNSPTKLDSDKNSTVTKPVGIELLDLGHLVFSTEILNTLSSE